MRFKLLPYDIFLFFTITLWQFSWWLLGKCQEALEAKRKYWQIVGELFAKMTPRKNRTEIFEEVIYYCAIPIDSDNLYDKVTRYIQVNYLILAYYSFDYHSFEQKIQYHKKRLESNVFWSPLLKFILMTSQCWHEIIIIKKWKRECNSTKYLKMVCFLSPQTEIIAFFQNQRFCPVFAYSGGILKDYKWK